MSNTGKPAEAEAVYRQAIRLQPSHHRSWINRGGVFARHGQWALALSDFREEWAGNDLFWFPS